MSTNDFSFREEVREGLRVMILVWKDYWTDWPYLPDRSAVENWRAFLKRGTTAIWKELNPQDKLRALYEEGRHLDAIVLEEKRRKSLGEFTNAAFLAYEESQKILIRS